MAEATEETTGNRSQMWKHEDFVEWATEEGFMDSKSSQAEVVAAFAANRNDYRKTERYSNLIEAHKAEQAEAKEARKAEREAASEARAAEREAAKAAKAEAKAAAEKEAPAKKAPAKKVATKKTTKAKSKVSSEDEDSPFGDD